MSYSEKSFFGKLSQRLNEALFYGTVVDDDLLDELEEILIMSDIGMDTTVKIVDQLRKDVGLNRIKEPEEVKNRLKAIIASLMKKGEANDLCDNTPIVILMVGINGGGKTTTIGKLAYKLKSEGRSVLLAAADTFRAAAVEQLCIWGDRAGVNVIKHQEGADPSAVIYDAIQSAKAKGIDALICDTAGRLQNKKNLMSELNKMSRVIEREFPQASRENLLILDATTGRNAISQVREFAEAADITGIVLTKLDGTAKGGIVVTIADEFQTPVKFIGVGEGIEDLMVFDPVEFVKGIVDE